jgi:hypothetical protein
MSRNQGGGQNRGQQQGGRKQGGGGASRVFVSLPTTAGAELVKAGSKKGTVDITVSLQQTHANPQFGIPCKIFVQGKQVGFVNVQNQQNYSMSEVSIDPSKDVEVRIEKAGFSNEYDSLLIPTDKLNSVLKGSAATNKATKPWRLKVEVAPLTSKKVNTVFLFVRDENGQPSSGTVIFAPGQRAKIDDSTWPVNTPKTVNIGPTGKDHINIQLLEDDATIEFLHAESGDKVIKSLLKEN